MKTKPLKQEEFSMKIIEDLGTISLNENSSKKSRYAIFECNECKKHFRARATGLTARNQNVCRECTLSKDQLYTHPLYAIWNGIKQRCYSEKRKDFHKYGGIGVTMSEEFKNSSEAFINFCLENGWNENLVVDKDIKSRELEIYPAVYSRETLSFISIQENAEEANGKEVLKYSLDEELLETFSSATNAALSLGKTKAAKSSIANCCRGITHTAFGFKWKYK